VLYMVTRVPRNDRAWSEEFARTASAVVQPHGVVVLNNVRDFTYGEGKIRSRAWLAQVPLRPADVRRIWYVQEPFGSSKAVAHVFISFEFRDGSAYSVSAEARMQHGEHFSIPRGMLNQYELTYSWGTERDFLTRRILYLKHPVYMYPMKVTPKQAGAVFLAMVAKTNELAAEPRFYNTLTDNCASSLARTVDKFAPGAVPFDIAWVLPGYSDDFLARTGYLAVPGPFEQTRGKYQLAAARGGLAAHANDPPEMLSSFVRTILPKPVH